MSDTLTHCGHPAACISSAAEGTAYCAWCADVARAQADLRSEEIRADASLLRAERAETERDAGTDPIDTAWCEGQATAARVRDGDSTHPRDLCPYDQGDTRRRWWWRGYFSESRLARATVADLERDEAMDILGAGREYLARDKGADLEHPPELPTGLVERARHVVEALAAETQGHDEARQENRRLRRALACYADPAEWHAAHGEPWRLRYNSSRSDDHGWAEATAALGRDPEQDKDND